MCHDVMAEGRQRGGILQEGVCKGGRGLQILCLDLHSYEPSASGSIQTQGTGQGPRGREIQFANFFYCRSKLFAHITILFVCSEHQMRRSCINVSFRSSSCASTFIGVRIRQVSCHVRNETV